MFDNLVKIHKMKIIVPFFLLLLLLCSCAANSAQPPTQVQAPSLADAAPTQPSPPGEMPTESTSLPSQELLTDWQYDLKKDGVYRADKQTGDTIRISGQDYALDIIITEDWVYFNDNSHLYRMDNENNRELLVDEACWGLSLNGSWLYYINNSGIIRMKPDGSEKVQVLEIICNRMVLTDQYIFYTLDVPEAAEINGLPGADDGPWYMGELHRIGLNGEGDMKVTDMITDLGVYENTIYFADGEDNKLYSLNPETLEKAAVYDGNFIEHLYFGGGFAFFILDRNLVKMSLADRTLTQLTDGYWNRCLGVLDGYVYGATDDPDAVYNFYRIKIDGVELEKVEK